MQVLNFAFLLAVLFSSAAQSQTVYTWVDENGTLHFNDVPNNKKAKAIDLPNFEQPALAPQFAPALPVEPQDTATPKPAEKPSPLEITITSPQDDQAIRSNDGTLMIQAELNRKLAIGEQLQLTVDNKRYGAPKASPQWQLKNLDRGTHSFVIQAFRDGKLIASSLPITVHLQRISVSKIKPSPKA
ncbi:DUF4124 domain-containing protein [Vibrio aquaticus]|uniref:DUF4124 domain-containing protein n=1 Tax=Vibrio aquaticus TaxID=2496559 RepID=A0A3S0QC18_9VIBR|nr:DUF4124 domain-containing protein [Vibrio aquaticus]RTZ14576.1 DUF4124 domain-containing protein [Vibrio aquaticus]